MQKLVGAAIAAVLIGAGCAGGGVVEGDSPVIVVTTTILGDITMNLAGDAAQVEVLMPIGADPHGYQLSARQAALLRDADLIIVNGLGLEQGLLDVIEQVEDEGIEVLRVAEGVDPQPFQGPAHAEADHDDSWDPHVWMDPVRMIDAAALIAGRLEAIGVTGVGQRTAGYQADLAALSASIEQQVATIPEPDRKLVTNHFSYGYYAARYGFRLIGTVIPAATTEAETSAVAFADLVDIIEREGVTVIFGSTSEPAVLAEAIGAEVGDTVEVIRLYTGSLGEPGSGADTYIGMMESTTEAIVAALRG